MLLSMLIASISGGENVLVSCAFFPFVDLNRVTPLGIEAKMFLSGLPKQVGIVQSLTEGSRGTSQLRLLMTYFCIRLELTGYENL